MNQSKKINAWYGWVPDRPDYRDKLYSAIAAPPKKLPPSVDLSSQCSAVEDQGQLGSCTANALVGNLEFLEKKSGKPVTNLSRLFIYYNERVMEGTVKEDAGAMIRDGVKSLANQGVCAEKQWPYTISKFAQQPSASCVKAALNRKVVSYHRLLSLQDMKKCLAEGYPFVFGFSVYEGFESPAVAKTGMLDLPQPGERQLGGHAIMAVGYTESTQRLLIRNSWGADWGLKGYFTMPYAYAANTNLADDFWTIRA